MDKDLQKKLEKVKLVATDLDGTLLDNHSRVSLTTKSLMKRLRHNNNLIFVLLTGRIHASAEPYADDLDLDTPLVSLNGSVVRLPHSKRYLYHAKLPVNAVSLILKLVKLYDVDSALVTSDTILYVANRNAIPSYLGGSEVRAVPVRSYDDHKKEVVEIALTSSFHILQEVMRALKEVFKDKLALMFYPSAQRAGMWYLELKNNGITKATGLDYVRKYFNIKLKEIAAVGDFYNDLEFCRVAGVTVAMKNSVDELKTIADYVTRHTNDNDGVAEFLTLLWEAKNKEGAGTMRKDI